MHPLTPFLATELDKERRADAARRSLARRARDTGDVPRSTVRRQLALALAAVSRGSAAAVRRLDECLADELAGRLAASR
jgi:ribosomal protein S7